MLREALICTLVVGGGLALTAQDEATRSITPARFLKARPAATTATKAKARTPAVPTYRRAGGPTTAVSDADTMDLGVTIWRLRAARSADVARLLVQDRESTTEWTPERIAVGTPLALGDRVRLSVESPRTGYLYVIDREQYADGSEGEPHLIFPTKRTLGGNNRVTAGRLVEIPAQDDRPPFFTMRPSRADQTGERLTIVVTGQPVKEIEIGEDAAPMSRALAADLESRGAGSVERLELVGGEGRAWSREEQRAGADATRLLRQDDPPPQTLFRIAVKQPDLIAVNLVLAHGKRRSP
jgi:hypothetical protein